ncbi:hypothetical protein O0I10_001319 [Lichtheimia ornata]|uniref:GPR1/FUN34/yaaH family-domain-containing protein n=1 Tax=Lichtheimia ornata TaxID=688661 RepID=A0AAD7Y3J9_9FUNG|nr:uncharacterized protein O0I10_001319 [Lichtheimia ornata]KAJ8663142.1 hypothetical protein O0I10_001319 [Lichtheimia ornata]
MDNHYHWTHNTCIQQPFQSPTDPISLNHHQEPSSNHNDAIEFTHEHPQHPYMIMTRAASPVVFGQGQRRPLSMGNPAVLGLWSFATVTLLLGTFSLFLPHKSNSIIFPTALLFGGIAQTIAGFFDLFYGGTFSSTILISYGCFWIGNGLMMLPSIQAPLTATYASEDDIAQANAIFHFIWAIYTLMVTAVSLRFKHGTFILTWCLAWVFCTLFLTGMYYAIGSQAILRTSGICAYMAAIGAYYSGCAAVFEEQNERWWVGNYSRDKSK